MFVLVRVAMIRFLQQRRSATAREMQNNAPCLLCGLLALLVLDAYQLSDLADVGINCNSYGGNTSSTDIKLSFMA